MMPTAKGPDRRRIAAIVLAAGASRRFGGHKLLAPLGGRPLIRVTVENTRDAGVDEIVVVLGREAASVRAALRDLPVRCVENRRFADGIAGSIRVGVRALSPGTTAALVVLGDQPSVGPAILDRLIAAYDDAAPPIVVPVYDGVRGNPVLFDASVFPELLRLMGDVGARGVIERAGDQVAAVAFAFPPPPDVDTPEDHAKMQARPGPEGSAGTRAG